ncbi:unnamed protein product [Prorocentrum cordatum]|uniref:Uncharacterized protein n=1 Tax=Prorocentrum cordatum TaxID=2364126 RepID=A0ABN9VBM6_9DINO|nr:unnamed protein product [Polarella glacialis]
MPFSSGLSKKSGNADAALCRAAPPRLEQGPQKHWQHLPCECRHRCDAARGGRPPPGVRGGVSRSALGAGVGKGRSERRAPEQPTRPRTPATARGEAREEEEEEEEEEAGTSNERRAGGGERPPFKTRPAKWRRQPPGARLPTKVRAKKPKCPPPPASESGGGKAGKATRMVFQTVCVFQACECRKTPGVSSDRDTPWGRPTGQRDTDGGKPWRPSKKIHAVGSPDQLGGKKRQYRSSSDLR